MLDADYVYLLARNWHQRNDPWGEYQQPQDNWIDVGFDWLLEHGPEPRYFDEGDYMTQSLAGSPGVNAAREAYRSGQLGSGELYEYDFGPSEFVRAFRPFNGTSHLLGGYYVRITDNGNGTATFQVANQTDWASGTNLRLSEQDVSLVERIQESISNRRLGIWPFKTILPDVPRDQAWFGGNLRQYYTWTEPLTVDVNTSP